MESRVLFDLVLLSLLLTASVSQAENVNQTNNRFGTQLIDSTKKEKSTDLSVPSDGPVDLFDAELTEKEKTYFTSPDIHGLTDIQKEVLTNVVKKIAAYLDTNPSNHQIKSSNSDFIDSDIGLKNEVKGFNAYSNNLSDSVDDEYENYDDVYNDDGEHDNNGDYNDDDIRKKYIGIEFGNSEEQERHESRDMPENGVKTNGNVNINIEKNDTRKIIKDDNVDNKGGKYGQRVSETYKLGTTKSSNDRDNKTKNEMKRIGDAINGTLKTKKKESEIIDQIDPIINEKLLEIVIKMREAPEKWKELHQYFQAQNQDKLQRIYSAELDKIVIAKKSKYNLPTLKNKKWLEPESENSWAEEDYRDKTNRKENDEKELRRKMLEKAGILRLENKQNKQEEKLGSKQSKDSKQSKQTLKTQDATKENSWQVPNQHYTESNIWMGSGTKANKNKIKSTEKGNKNNFVINSNINKPDYQNLNSEYDHNHSELQDISKSKNYDTKNENDNGNSKTQVKNAIKNNKESPTTQLRKLLVQNDTGKGNKSSRGMHELYMKLGKLKSNPSESIRSNTARLSYVTNYDFEQGKEESVQNEQSFKTFSEDYSDKLSESKTSNQKWQSIINNPQGNRNENHQENLPQQKQKEAINNHKNYGVLAYTRYRDENWEKTSQPKDENIHPSDNVGLLNGVSTDNYNAKNKNINTEKQNYQNVNFKFNNNEDLSTQNLGNVRLHESSRENGRLMAYPRYVDDTWKGPGELYDSSKTFSKDDDFKSEASSNLNVNEMLGVVNSLVNNKNLNTKELNQHATYKEEGNINHQNNHGLLAGSNEKWKDPVNKYWSINKPNGVSGNENSPSKYRKLNEKWKGNYKQKFDEKNVELNEENFPFYEQSNYKSVDFNPVVASNKQEKWRNLLRGSNRFITNSDKNGLLYTGPKFEPVHELTYLPRPRTNSGSTWSQYYARDKYPIKEYSQKSKYVTLMKFPSKLKSSSRPTYKTHQAIHSYHTMLNRMKSWLKKITKLIYPEFKEHRDKSETLNTWKDRKQNMNKHYKQANNDWSKLPGKTKSSKNLKLKLHYENSRNGPHFIYHRVSSSPKKTKTHKNAFVSVSVELPPRVNNSFRNWSSGKLGSSSTSSMSDILERELVTLASKSWNHEKKMNKLKEQLQGLLSLDKYLQYQWLKEKALRSMLQDNQKLKLKSGNEQGSIATSTYMDVGY